MINSFDTIGLQKQAALLFLRCLIKITCGKVKVKSKPKFKSYSRSANFFFLAFGPDPPLNLLL